MHRITASIAAAALCIALASPAGAAGEALTGTVLMAPSAGEAVIHHAAFGGMPAMTMTFRLPAQLHVEPGDRISADVDRSSEPWTLSGVRVLGGTPATPAIAETPLARVGDRVPDPPFVDEHGRRLSLRSLAGAPFAMTFIYTRCTDGKMCPLISAKFHALQQRLTRPAALVEVSLDPAYDRPPVLARYGAAFGADTRRWHLLTGDPRAVLDFAAHFGILEAAAGPVKIVHSERLAIVDAAGRIVRFYDNARWSPADVLEALRSGTEQTARR